MSAFAVSQTVASAQTLPRLQENAPGEVSTGGLASCLYEGIVRHCRRRNSRHQFRYKILLVYLDLQELDRVFNMPPLWSTRWLSAFRFRREDYFGDPNQSLSSAIRELVNDRLGCSANGPIRLLTLPRTFNQSFNPISLYYCFDHDAEDLQAVVAEVSNTPWNERHCYVIPWTAGNSVQRFECDKLFHVSPFMPMEMSYRWRVTAPSERLTVHIENFDHQGLVFDATLLLNRIELTGRSKASAAFRFPLAVQRTLMRIYWQALRLWWKKTPYFAHPDRSRAESN